MFLLARNELKSFKIVNVLAIVRKYIIKYFFAKKAFLKKIRNRWHYKTIPWN